MKKIILTAITLVSSITFFGQNILTQSQEIRKGDLYFGVSSDWLNYENSKTIGAKIGLWSANNSVYDYEAAGIILNRWTGTDLVHSNAYIGQTRHNISSGWGLSFGVSLEDSRDTKPTTRMFITPNGYVGIGTTIPDSELTVDGTVHCEEVLVDLNVDAPDYVFEKYYTGVSELKEDYTMPTLEEVEAYTKENHHLPNVPSAKEIKEEGLHLKEMTNLLLQKIEELTLYTIEQEKRIKTLEGKLATKE